MEKKNYRQYRYSADAGSLLVGDANFAISIGNDYGDGDYKFRVYDSGINYKEEKENWVFKNEIDGTFYVFRYDCLNKEERTDAIAKHKAVKLEGNYQIFTSKTLDGNIAFIKWD